MMNFNHVTDDISRANGLAPTLGSGAVNVYSVMCGVPIAIAPSGTMGANGAVTLGTALGNAYAGIWLYFKAGAVYAGSVAGFYWTVMSTTTAGTVYDNIYTVVDGVKPTRISSPTAIVAAGPGAFTGETTEIEYYSETKAGGLLGANGKLIFETISEWDNSATTKSLRGYFGGTSVHTSNGSTTVARSHRKMVTNSGSESAQVVTASAVPDPFNATATASQYLTVNTASSFVVAFKMQTGAATDYVVCNHFSISTVYSD